MLDEWSFDRIARSVAPDSTDRPLLLMDNTLRICGVNKAYERATQRERGELIGRPMFEAFPDNPDDPQACGVHHLTVSLEKVLRTGCSHDMWVQRYDIPDLANPGAFIPKVWAPRNSPVRDDGRVVGVLHRVDEITELHGALSAMALAIESDDALPPDEQFYTLAAFTAALPHDPRQRLALVAENEHLRKAVHTRDIIGQAKGMLMERYDIDANSAFQLLVKLSQESNTKVADVAQHLVDIDHPSTPADH